MAKPKKTTKRKKQPKQVKYVSFKPCRDTRPFVQFKITDQTVYWSVMLILILLLGLWVVDSQIKILDILQNMVHD